MKPHQFITVACIAFSSPALADAPSCIVGLWSADIDDMAHVFKEQMQAASVTATGDVRIRIYPDGRASMSVTDLEYIAEIPEIAPIKTTLNGVTDYEMVWIEDRIMTVFTDEFDIVAQSEVYGETITVPVTSDSGIFGGGTVDYGCSPDSFAVARFVYFVQLRRVLPELVGVCGFDHQLQSFPINTLAPVVGCRLLPGVVFAQ